MDNISISNDSNEEKDSNDVNEEKDDGGLSNELSINSSSNNNKKKKNTCLFCLKDVEGLQGCSKCGTARYCGRECQVKHWPVHKNNCQDSNDTEDSNHKLDLKAYNNSKQGSCIYIYISNGYHHD